MEDFNQEQPVVENTTTDFRTQLSEDLRSDPSLQNFKDLNSLAKSYISAQQMIGRSIRIPTEDANEEQRQDFYNRLSEVPGVARLPRDENDKELYYKLGLPETPDYGIEIEGIPQQELEGVYQQFHHLNLTKSQAEGVMDMYLDMQNQATEMMQGTRGQAEQVLRQKWGPEFDTRMAAAKNVIQDYAQKFPNEVNQLVNGPAGNNPAFIAMLSEMAGAFQEKGSANYTSQPRFGISSEEALEKIAEIRSNRKHPVHNAHDPDHEASVEKLKKLYEIAYPG